MFANVELHATLALSAYMARLEYGMDRWLWVFAFGCLSGTFGIQDGPFNMVYVMN